jgi:predicted PurR-regulated permease PerM
MNEMKRADNPRFLAYLTLSMIAASLWIFSPYLDYMLVAAVLALATSHVHAALVNAIDQSKAPARIREGSRVIVAGLLTLFFLAMIFIPLLYFVAVTYDQISGLDMSQLKQTLMDMIDKGIAFLHQIPFLKGPLETLHSEGIAAIKGPAIEAGLEAGKGLISGAGALFGQMVWILLFYFLFNLYGRQILAFASALIPMKSEDEGYLYQECTGTVSVVFYGTLFNMAAQGFAFALLMAVVGGYNAFYLGILTGFCSVVPVVGAALVYVPVIALELLGGNFLTAALILGFAWVVMGFLIDNVLRVLFIGYLKKKFGFQYRMNEIFILLSILAGIATVGFWGLIIGPSVLALTLAAANLFSIQHGGKTPDGEVGR